MDPDTKWNIITILGMNAYGYKLSFIANLFKTTEEEISHIIESYTYHADV